MEELGLFEGKEDRVIPLKYSDRSKTPIEPYLSDQWFVKMGDRDDGKPGLAQMAMDAVTERPGEVLPGALRRALTSTGSARSATGASAGNSGGATAFRCGRQSRQCAEALEAAKRETSTDYYAPVKRRSAGVATGRGGRSHTA